MTVKVNWDREVKSLLGLPRGGSIGVMGSPLACCTKFYDIVYDLLREGGRRPLAFHYEDISALTPYDIVKRIYDHVGMPMPTTSGFILSSNEIGGSMELDHVTIYQNGEPVGVRALIVNLASNLKGQAKRELALLFYGVRHLPQWVKDWIRREFNSDLLVPLADGGVPVFFFDEVNGATVFEPSIVDEDRVIRLPEAFDGQALSIAKADIARMIGKKIGCDEDRALIMAEALILDWGRNPSEIHTRLATYLAKLDLLKSTTR